MSISELADHKVENPEEIVKVGEEIEVKILRVDSDERKIGLSRKRVEWAEEAEAEAQAAAAPPAGAPAVELKGGVGSSSGPLIQPIQPAAEERPAGNERQAADEPGPEPVAAETEAVSEEQPEESAETSAVESVQDEQPSELSEGEQR